jgi:hypothetical protein
MKKIGKCDFCGRENVQVITNWSEMDKMFFSDCVDSTACYWHVEVRVEVNPSDPF